MIGVINIHINPVAFDIHGLAIHWYGIMYAIAFYVAYRFGAMAEAKRRGIDRAMVEKLTVTTIIVGLICARLYYVIQQPDLVTDYIEKPANILAVWQGGMAFFGAIIGAVIALTYMAWRHHLNFWILFDGGALFAVLGQPIGRIGNLINGDILGSRSNAWFATAYTYPTGAGHCAVLQAGYVCGAGYQPAALYEMLGTIAIGIVIYVIRRRRPPVGVLGLTYLALYCVSQFLLSFLRQSEPVIGLGLKQLQWTSLVVLIVGVPLLLLVRRRFPGHLPSVAPVTAADAGEEGTPPPSDDPPSTSAAPDAGTGATADQPAVTPASDSAAPTEGDPVPPVSSQPITAPLIRDRLCQT